MTKRFRCTHPVPLSRPTVCGRGRTSTCLTCLPRVCRSHRLLAACLRTYTQHMRWPISWLSSGEAGRYPARRCRAGRAHPAALAVSDQQAATTGARRQPCRIAIGLQSRAVRKEQAVTRACLCVYVERVCMCVCMNCTLCTLIKCMSNPLLETCMTHSTKGVW